MRNGLCIRGNTVMLGGGKIDVLRAETRENLFDQSETFVRCFMLNKNLLRVQRLQGLQLVNSRLHTNGWPFGSTPGPCREWHDTM